MVWIVRWVSDLLRTSMELLALLIFAWTTTYWLSRIVTDEPVCIYWPHPPTLTKTPTIRFLFSSEISLHFLFLSISIIFKTRLFTVCSSIFFIKLINYSTINSILSPHTILLCITLLLLWLLLLLLLLTIAPTPTLMLFNSLKLLSNSRNIL